MDFDSHSVARLAETREVRVALAEVAWRCAQAATAAPRDTAHTATREGTLLHSSLYTVYVVIMNTYEGYI